MTESKLEVPSLGRMVKELDGLYPGLTLFEIVTQRTGWTLSAKKHWKDPFYQHLLFEGAGDNFKASYHAGRWLEGKSHPGFFDFCGISNIKLTLVADKVREYPKTTIKVSNLIQNFGASQVHIITSYGPDFSVPVWGLHSESTWPGSCVFLSKCLGEWRSKGEFDSLALTKMEGGQLFLARMALELGIHWEERTLSITETSVPEEVSSRFAAIILRGIETA